MMAATIHVAVNGSNEPMTISPYSTKFVSNIPVALCTEAELVVLVILISSDKRVLRKMRSRTLFCSVADIWFLHCYFYRVRG